MSELARQAMPDLASLSDRALDHLWEGLMDLPAVDLTLLVTLPKLIGPDLQRLRETIEHDDPDWGWDALTAVAKQIDTPQQRARLADAIIQLRDQHRINRRQAAYALLDLGTRSTRLIGASLLEAIAVSIGASRTQRPPHRRLAPTVYPGEVTRTTLAHDHSMQRMRYPSWFDSRQRRRGIRNHGVIIVAREHQFAGVILGDSS